MAKRRKTRPIVKHARRLASGKYSYRGKARAFSKLPQKERNRLQALWAKRATIAANKNRPKRRRGPPRGFVRVYPTLHGKKLPARVEKLIGQPAEFQSSWVYRGRGAKKRRWLFKICRDVAQDRGNLRETIFKLQWAAEDHGYLAVSFVATCEWPDAIDRHGRPSVTHASTRFFAEAADAADDAREYFEDIQETPLILDQARGRSGRPGRVVIVQICVLLKMK